MENDSIIVVSSTSIREGIAIPANGRRNIVTIGGGKKSYKGFFEYFQKFAK